MNKKFLAIIISTLMMLFILSACTKEEGSVVEKSKVEDSNVEEQLVEKPVLYFYSDEELDVSVSLDYEGELTTTYPKYDKGWYIRVFSDGSLLNYSDNKYYSNLFWEGISNINYDFNEGFVVKGEETANFLDEKLCLLGLNIKERNEFIMYWLPRMENNRYNQIKFVKDEYTQVAKLKITPEPDTLIRVFMAFKPLNEFVEIKEQDLAEHDRRGFSVVEWGGIEVK